MSREFIYIDKVGELIGEEPYYVPWFPYDLGGGYGFNSNRKNAIGGVISGVDRDVRINIIAKKIKKEGFDGVAGFYVGILCFFGDRFYDRIDMGKNDYKSVSSIVNALKCDSSQKTPLYELCYGEYDFVEFAKAAAELDKVSFDVDSVLSVYRLQGDKAIFGLLCQMFYTGVFVESISPGLVPGVPIELNMEVSNYLSGCHFPVAVCPNPDGLVWRENDNGWFLYGAYKDEELVVDVAGVGSVNLSNYALANRLNYFGGGGRSVPYLVCWNWLDVVNAYHHFGEDLLVRDLRNDLFTNYWFVFGPNSLLNVRYTHDHINTTTDFLIERKGLYKYSPTDKVASYITITLNGDFVDTCKKSEVFYSDEEIYDWFEIGSML